MAKWARRGYELPYRLLGRPIRPFHFAVAIATGTIAVANLFFGGIVLEGNLGDFVGSVALLSTVLLVFGWWRGNDRAAEWGLLLAAGAWTARAMFALLSPDHPNSSVVLSMAWVVGASGAWLLERYDHKVAR